MDLGTYITSLCVYSVAWKRWLVTTASEGCETSYRLCLNYLAQYRHSKNSTSYQSRYHLHGQDLQLGPVFMALDFPEGHWCTLICAHARTHTHTHTHTWIHTHTHTHRNTYKLPKMGSGFLWLKNQYSRHRLVERAVCFISEVGNQRRKWTYVQLPTPHSGCMCMCVWMLGWLVMSNSL